MRPAPTAATPPVPGRARAPRARALALVLAVLLALLGLVACSGGVTGTGATADEGAVDSGGDSGAAEAAPVPEEVGAAPEEGSQDAAEAVLSGADGGGNGRRVVTSSIDVAVQDVEAAAVQVRTLAVRVGGEVAGESSTGGERPRAEIVLRVPTTDAPGVLTDVAALGVEVARTSESDPVEARLVDLESRTATQRAGVERIRALLAQATTLEDVLALETELTRRQADLESIDAQRAALDDLAALATVTVRLTTPEDVAAPERDLPPFLQGLDAGWDALAASSTVVLVILGSLLPFGVVGAVVLGLVVFTLRRVRRRRPAPGPTS